VVQRVLEEVAFGTDENVREETAEVLPELQDVEHLHLEGHVGDMRGVVSHIQRIAVPAQPGGHEGSFADDFVGPDGTDEVIDDGIAPLHQSVGTLLAGLGRKIALFGDVILLAGTVQQVVDQQIEALGRGRGTVNRAA
jgi:hypothetical protein